MISTDATQPYRQHLDFTRYTQDRDLSHLQIHWIIYAITLESTNIIFFKKRFMQQRQVLAAIAGLLKK